MLRRGFLVLVFVLSIGLACFAQDSGLVVDEFEVIVSGGPQGTLDYGAGGGSSVEVSAPADIKYSGEKSLKVTYNAVNGGYIWVARGFDLDAANAGWLVKPEEVKWEEYNAISFYMYGSDSKTKVAFDLKDSSGEIWRFITEDNFQGWKKIVCPFSQFFARDDWQPEGADKNGKMDFPLKSYQFEPLPESKGTLYFDRVELVKQ